MGKPSTAAAVVMAGGVGVGGAPPLQPKSRWWSYVSMREDNARFLLLGFVLILYMVIGAFVFQVLEEPQELDDRRVFNESFNRHLVILNESLIQNNVTLEQIKDLLYLYGNATSKGVTSPKRLWDYAGAFHFVYTVVSTIGYGAASPSSKAGKIFCIFYGLVGCSSGVLFFNLFLERIITLLACIMRSRHERRRRKAQLDQNDSRRHSTGTLKDEDDEDQSLDAWKPSVYWVMFYLSVASLVVAFSAAFLFSQIEKWSYTDSLYFCFISFATIGFGDFVSAQESNDFYGSGVFAYRFANFFFLVVGCCCIYSLFNVISITIKQFLNWIIKRMVYCCTKGRCSARPRRNSVTPSRFHRHSIKKMDRDIDSVCGSETERKLSGEMVSMREYISSNKVSLAVMQKQLYETAQLGRSSSSHHHGGSEERFTPGQVGPLAIASSKLV